MKRITKHPIGFSFAVMVVFFSTILIFQLEPDPFEVRYIDNKKPEVQNINCGDAIVLRREICSTKQVTVYIKRSYTPADKDLYNGVIHMLDGEYSTKNGYKCEKVVSSIPTPKFLKNGLYKYQATLIYEVNLFKKIVKEAPPEYFQVTRPEGCN